MSNNSQSTLPVQRIGADNDGLSDSFNDATIRSRSNDLDTSTIACDNTEVTHAFTGARIIVSATPSAISSTTTIASDNHNVHHVFEGAKVNTPATQSSRTASGNRNMSRCFQGFHVGSEEPQVQVGSRTLYETKKGSNLSGHPPPAYSNSQSDPFDSSSEVKESMMRQWLGARWADVIGHIVDILFVKDAFEN